MNENRANPVPLKTRVDDILAKFQEQVEASRPDREKLSDEWLWDDKKDSRYAHSDPRFNEVLHVFHKEWHGIRAACGSLPGKKLAITEVTLHDSRISLLALEVRQMAPKQIIFHGYSRNAASLIRKLNDAGLRHQLFLVYHGSPAQWWNEGERMFAFEAIDLARAGLVRRLHVMKKGMELPEVPLFQPLLYNMSPKHSLRPTALANSDIVSVFVPGWGNWIKNVFGSAYGASLSERVDEIWAYAEGLQLPGPLNNKVVLLNPSSREETFKRYLATRMTLNVSLIDCHPMVNVESQAMGRPCIRANLNLDAYEDHPYVKLVSVFHNNSPLDVRDAVNRTLDVPDQELTEMIADYQSKIDATAISRYIEFLEL